MIGAAEAIEMAEDRKLFREAMDRIGLKPQSDDCDGNKDKDGKADLNEGVRHALEAGRSGCRRRPAFTLAEQVAV